MTRYIYKVIPAPSKGRKSPGVKGAEARFAHGLEEAMNEMAAEGWEYLRADILPSEERQGLTSTATVYRSVLVFRRPAEQERAEAKRTRAERAEPVAPSRPPEAPETIRPSAPANLPEPAVHRESTPEEPRFRRMPPLTAQRAGRDAEAGEPEPVEEGTPQTETREDKPQETPAPDWDAPQEADTAQENAETDPPEEGEDTPRA